MKDATCVYFTAAAYLVLLLVLLAHHVTEARFPRIIDNNESYSPYEDMSVEEVDTRHYLQKSEKMTTDHHLKKLGKKIPMELLKQLQDIATYDDLVKTMGEPGRKFNTRSFRSSLIASRPTKMRRNNSTTSPAEIGPIFDKRAFCNPRRVPVHVPQPLDPMLIFQPTCIQIERCGGCCAHELFHCVPSLKRNATRKVVALRYPHSGADFFEYEDVTAVKIERHVRCHCQCKVQPEDCSVHQVYNKESCRCSCPKGTNQVKCKPPQVWSERDCKCRCPEQDDCSTGTYFDPRVCRCRSTAEILAHARIYKNPWLKSYIPEEKPSSS